MEILKKKYYNFKKCYESLGKIIDLQEQLSDLALINPVAQDLFTGGVIQHFEITYETAWKYLKQYLIDIHEKDVNSPKQVFRECAVHRLFPQNITSLLITLADARNTTTHIYDQILAKEVCNAIIQHYHVFGEIINTISILNLSNE